MENLITGNKEIFQYIFAGNSTFTIKNTKTGNRLTYKIKKSPYTYQEHQNVPYFVRVLTTPDTYTFLGTIFFNQNGKFTYKRSIKSRIFSDSSSNRVMEWFLDVLSNNTIPKQIEFWHCGKCCKCGRKLTVPESIKSGIGPECAKYFNM